MGRAIRIALMGMAVMISTTSTASAEATFANRGMGKVSCGAYTSDPKIASQALQWVFGFVTGTNATMSWAAKTRHVDMLNGVDAGGVRAWLKAYCEANPLKSMTQATMELIKVSVKDE